MFVSPKTVQTPFSFQHLALCLGYSRCSKKKKKKLVEWEKKNTWRNTIPMASCFQMEIHTSTKETLLFHKDIFDCWDQERARCMLGITPSRLSLSLGSACQQRRWFLVCSHSHYTGLSSLDLWLSKSDDNWVNSKLIWNELLVELINTMPFIPLTKIYCSNIMYQALWLGT